MNVHFQKQHQSPLYRILCGFIAITFITSSVIPPQRASAQTVLNLPIPGTMIPVTAGFTPAVLKGVTINPDNPLEFDFVVDTGDDHLTGEALRVESIKLVKYFLASLTVPEKDMWVNLSPYEKKRVIPQGFGETEMGRDLLAQDYMLKQLTASLMYPENELGQSFWKRVKARAKAQFGTSDISMSTFNKVWIVPEDALVYEDGYSAYVVESKLKVMLEEDYIALQQANVGNGLKPFRTDTAAEINKLQSQIIKEIIIPELEKEVNQGATFANLRQIFQSMILASWYKENLQNSLLAQVYVDQNKTKGVDTHDPQINQKIYDQYLETFQQGVYDYIKEDYDPATQEIVPRKYFSGGAGMDRVSQHRRGITSSELPSADSSMVSKVIDGLGSPNPTQRLRVLLEGRTRDNSAAVEFLEDAVNQKAFEDGAMNAEKVSAITEHVFRTIVYDQLRKIARNYKTEDDKPFAGPSDLIQQYINGQLPTPASTAFYNAMDKKAYNPEIEARRFFTGIDTENVAELQALLERVHDYEPLDNIIASLRKMNIDSGLVELVAQIFRNRSLGLATMNTRDDLRATTKDEVASFIRQIIRDAIPSRGNNNIAKIFIDGSSVETLNQNGRWIIRATPSESVTNWVTGTANGTSFDVYEKLSDGTIGTQPAVSIGIQWGSNVRVFVATKERALDFILTGNNVFIEIPKEGEDNYLRVKEKGTTVSLGGESKWRPGLAQKFEAEYLDQTPTKARHSDSATADLYKIIIEGGYIQRWLTIGQAKNFAQILTAAGAQAKMVHSGQLVNILDVPITEDNLNSDQQVYVYAGTSAFIENLNAIAKKDNVDLTNRQTRKRPKAIELPTMDHEETLDEYWQNNVVAPNTEVQSLRPQMKSVIDAVETALTTDIAIISEDMDRLLKTKDPQTDQERLLYNEMITHDSVRAIKRGVIFKKDNGKWYIRNLQWILDNLFEEQEGSANASGDAQKLLDAVFNPIFKYLANPYVHVIISEEDAQPVYGIGQTVNDTTGARLMMVLDPIDGSSMIKDGKVFGSIFGFGVLHDGQSMEDGSFSARKQMMLAFDIKYGTHINMTFANPRNSKGQGELAQFTLDNNGNFRRELVYKAMIDTEIELDWEGLVPKFDSSIERASVRLAPGGSIATAVANSGQGQFLKWIKQTYGVDIVYTGSLLNDMAEIMLAHLSGTPYGGMYNYPFQEQRDKATNTVTGQAGKLRLFFEGFAYAFMLGLSGGEVSTGFEPHYNHPIQDQGALNGIKVGFSAGSSWMTKLEMAWTHHLSQNPQVIAQGEEAMNSEWVRFITDYKQKTADLVKQLVSYSQSPTEKPNVTAKTEKDIIRALLTFDSTDKGDNYFPNLINAQMSEVFDKIFSGAVTIDNAAVATIEEAQRAMLITPTQTSSLGASWSDANTTTDNVGGINLDRELLNLQIKRDGQGIPLPLNQQPIFEMNIEGFAPIIINVTPIPNLPLMLGLIDRNDNAPTDFGYQFDLDPAEKKSRIKAREPEQVSYLN